MSEPLVRTVRVACPVEHAFDVFTSRLDMWWPRSHRRFERSRLHLEVWEGGRFFECSHAGDEAELGRVVRCEPPHRITYTWHPGAIVGPTEVDVRFVAEGEHTVVEVVHAEGASELGDAWPARVQRFARAWSEVLPAFVELASGARG